MTTYSGARSKDFLVERQDLPVLVVLAFHAAADLRERDGHLSRDLRRVHAWVKAERVHPVRTRMTLTRGVEVGNRM